MEVVAVLSGVGAVWALAYGLRRWNRRPVKPPACVTIDDAGVSRRDGETELCVKWSELTRIAILTTDEGPFVDDLFWVFEDVHANRCIVPGTSIDGLFDQLARLPNVDYGAIIAAQGSTDHALFEVWMRRLEPRDTALR